MIDRGHELSVTRQAAALKISRGSVYYLPRPVSCVDLKIMRRLDELHLEFPFTGSRMLRGLLACEGIKIGRRPRLVEPPRVVVAAVDHAGGGVLR